MVAWGLGINPTMPMMETRIPVRFQLHQYTFTITRPGKTLKVKEYDFLTRQMSEDGIYS
jgi:hypothetical protein